GSKGYKKDQASLNACFTFDPCLLEKKPSPLTVTPLYVSARLSLENISPTTILKRPTITKYTTATFHPNSTHNVKIITGFMSGEAIKKLIDGPKGTFEFNNPARIGIVEQEQKGVTAPKSAPKI